MKKKCLYAIACCIPSFVLATEIVAPDMDLGHWVTTVDTSAMIEQTLASIPESNREMVREMMEQKMKESGATEQCITKELLTNYDQQIKEIFGDGSSCKMNVTESTSKRFVATMNCSGAVMHITTNAINSRRIESRIVSAVAGAETEITSVSEWKSNTCPAGL